MAADMKVSFVAYAVVGCCRMYTAVARTTHVARLAGMSRPANMACVACSTGVSAEVYAVATDVDVPMPNTTGVAVAETTDMHPAQQQGCDGEYQAEDKGIKEQICEPIRTR